LEETVRKESLGIQATQATGVERASAAHQAELAPRAIEDLRANRALSARKVSQAVLASMGDPAIPATAAKRENQDALAPQASDGKVIGACPESKARKVSAAHWESPARTEKWATWAIRFLDAKARKETGVSLAPKALRVPLAFREVPAVKENPVLED